MSQHKAKTNNHKIIMLWFTIFTLILLAVLMLTTPLAGKIKRGILSFRKPAITKIPDTKELEKKIETNLRKEFEKEYADKINTFKKADSAKSNAALPTMSNAAFKRLGDIKMLRSGVPFSSVIETKEGQNASTERNVASSYTTEYKVNIHVPSATKTMTDLKKNNPNLSVIFPKLERLLEQAEVSPFYKIIYDNKINQLKRNTTNVKELITKHNFYDLETMLQFRDPETSRNVFLMQADMDVVSDGSDGDRLSSMPDEIVNSPNYQPFTSYAWKKTTENVNPMISGWESRIVTANTELRNPTTTASRKKWLQSRVDILEKGIADMKTRSHLIADFDPFIVIPVNLLVATDNSFTPRVGDYAVVVYQSKIYPAIVGDGGPSYKVGEASLRLAKEINPSSSSYQRPVSDLKVTYLIFPNSREKINTAPDYEKWKNRCNELLKDIGGLGTNYELHSWQNLLPPVIPPTVK
jgi:Fungal chitosanase of glycosyl hydrolase group 75